MTKGGVEPQPRSKAARFYGGVGLQLEESTPERFLRLAKLAKEERAEVQDAVALVRQRVLGA